MSNPIETVDLSYWSQAYSNPEQCRGTGHVEYLGSVSVARSLAPHSEEAHARVTIDFEALK